MKRIILVFCIATILFSCATTGNNEEASTEINPLYEEFLLNTDIKQKIAVMPFFSEELSTGDLKGIQLHFETSMQQSNHFDMIEQSETETILNAQAYTLNGFTDEKNALTIGKLLSADQIIIGNIGIISDIYYLNTKLIDVESGKILVSNNIHGSNIKELLYVISPDLNTVIVQNNKVKIKSQESTKSDVNIIDFKNDGFVMNVEYKNIIIDGLDKDWEGIDPLELSKYDNNPYYQSFYVAQDENFLYLRLNVLDRSLFTEGSNDFFFSIHPSIEGGKGQIQFGINMNNMVWGTYITQKIIDDGDDSKWEWGKLPRGYTFVKDIIEIKIEKKWLPNKDDLFIAAAIWDGKNQKDLFWSDHFQFNL